VEPSAHMVHDLTLATVNLDGIGVVPDPAAHQQSARLAADPVEQLVDGPAAEDISPGSQLGSLLADLADLVLPHGEAERRPGDDHRNDCRGERGKQRHPGTRIHGDKSYGRRGEQDGRFHRERGIFGDSAAAAVRQRAHGPRMTPPAFLR
jgi:hypothetical protein